MSELQSTFDKLKTSNKYRENAQILTVLLNMFSRTKKPIYKEDLAAITGFIFYEMKKLIDLIPKTSDYKMKDEIFGYSDKLMGFFMLIKEQKCNVSEENLQIIRNFTVTVADAQVPETAINKMFNFDKIEKSDAVNVLDIVKPLTNEFQRGKFYHGLLNYKEKTDKITDAAKNEIAEYICEEFERYLKKKDSLTKDEINNLEIASDVCKQFINNKTIVLLKKILFLKHNNIRYYAVETLLLNKQEIHADIVAEMAADLIYADLTYSLLKRYGLSSLFPKELSNPEYLAKSDMVHWLDYPTELGKTPDAIELIGNVKLKGDLYYIFKYKSDSDTLGGDLKNEWLIGWSSNNGGTFSHFDKLSLFEHKNPKKTLKNIRKKGRL